jgi:hypothetical protein
VILDQGGIVVMGWSAVIRTRSSEDACSESIFRFLREYIAVEAAALAVFDIIIKYNPALMVLIICRCCSGWDRQREVGYPNPKLDIVTDKVTSRWREKIDTILPNPIGGAQSPVSPPAANLSPLIVPRPALIMLRVPLRRAVAGAARPPVHSQLAPSLQSPIARLQTRMQSQALSNPTLANIEKRWEAMPPQEQAELWMALRDRMKVDWHELTPMEKKAC